MLRVPSHANQSKTAPETERPAHFRIFKDDREVPPEELPVQRAARGETVRHEELRVVFDDGSFIDELVSATPIRDSFGAVTGAVAASIDISERSATEAQVRHAALHDPLTSLPNRFLFHDRLAQAMARAQRHEERATVMLLDLDRFKQINDSLSHAAGDTLLRHVAGRIRSMARDCDTCARLGGDEFALVVGSLSTTKEANVITRRILAALDEPFHVEGQELDVHASLGVALFPDDGDTSRRLLRNADVALYRAKAAGRRRVRHYRPEMDQARRADHSLQIGLRRALKGNGLELVYQPVFDLTPDGQRLAKVEALLRWRPPGGSSVPPSSFIPVAEGSGLIHEIGAWVLRMACRQAKAWADEGRPVKTAVNVSAAQLRQAKFRGLVQDALRDAELEPALLELELTESVFLDPSKDQIHETLRRLAELGVTLAIDDFGTGYSSLAYLQHLPFDEVKLDGVFLTDADGSHVGSAVAAAAVKLAHSLGKRLTADGVETEAQLAFLREQGCDAAQGYFLAPPGPAEAVSRLLAA